MKIILLGGNRSMAVNFTLGYFRYPNIDNYFGNKNTKNKAKADTLDSIVKTQNKNSIDPLDKIERLNKLRESGALTQEEFEKEKKKILG